ncbi:MAG TPA: hypothetical protein VM327_06970 [Candidatus Thermoplasmatota archaeon]|nr:hypothetical protein [Candidatus Thermoplasmatota archaeon]
MGASWRRGSAAALLLVLAAALAAPAGMAGSAAAPEVTDPADDQEVDDGSVPILPGVNDVDFGDVDILAAFVSEFGDLTRLTVQTTSGWTTGSMILSFNITSGPTSLPSSQAIAAGTRFTVYVNGTTVGGVAGSAAATTDGLRVDLRTGALGAVGGDVLADLTITTTRTDPGKLQGVPQDDQTGSDTAGPGLDYAFSRPPVVPRLDLAVVSVGGKAGPYTANETRSAIPVVLRITNLGLDPDGWQLRVTSDPPLADAPVFAQAFTPIDGGATAETTVPLSLAGMDEGPIVLTFTASSERGATATATTTITVDLPSSPPADREVKPAGLTFLTPAAEAMGLDDSFGRYGEAFLLALIVLLTILAIFLLLALGRSTTKGEPASEAPWPAGAGATPAAFVGPGGLAETVRASPPRSTAPSAPAESADGAPEGLMDFGALAAAAQGQDVEEAPPPESAARPAPLPTAAAGARVRIEEVRHTPREPEAGQGVTTEVILRNDGPSTTLRIALSVDGKPAAERTVQVASRATKAVELPWTAGAGDNRVRIQAFPA